MFSYFDSLLNDPIGMITVFLLALPGRLLAISAHECAHAFVADRCGDHTARNMGRLTLNPLKHLDVVGTLMMVFVGIGWAKPVPVNPNNYRNYRRDDFLVSIAGITMNIILFLLGSIVMYGVIGFALHRAAQGAYPDELFIEFYNGAKSLFIAENGSYSYIPLTELLRYAPYISDYLIVPMFGRVAGYLMQMLSYFVIVNLMLAVFNLIPMPPLDGYHVLNDIFLRRELFASRRAAQIFSGVMLLLMFSGVLSKALGAVQTWTFELTGNVSYSILTALGVI